MIFESQRIIFVLWILTWNFLAAWCQSRHVCLTGTMMDVQNWVDHNGHLTLNIDQNEALDLSSVPNLSSAVVQSFYTYHIPRHRPKSRIRYLSLARCHLTRIPSIFDSFEDSHGRNLSRTVEYLTLYGNKFVEISTPGLQYDVELTAIEAREININSNIKRNQVRSMWSAGFQRVKFRRLRELDLRNCGITTLNADIFQSMPLLEALYLGENAIHTINKFAFNGLSNLKHIDLSMNIAPREDGAPRNVDLDNDVFANLNLKSLDLSGSMISIRRLSSLKILGEGLERLSLCFSNAKPLPSNFFEGVSLKILDVSGNHGILSNQNVLVGLENSLEVLYANEIGLNTFDIFQNFSKLEILRVGKNEITSIRPSVARSLVNLQALDIRRNRLTNWLTEIVSKMPSLQLLDLRGNMITIISSEMLNDFSNVSYLAMSENSIVCNCHSKEFIEIAARNEQLFTVESIKPLRTSDEEVHSRFNYHSGFKDVNSIIFSRRNVSSCEKPGRCREDIEQSTDANFLLVDYEEGNYRCLMIAEGEKMPFTNVNGCVDPYKSSLVPKLERGRKQLLALIAIPGVLLPAMLIVYIFRRNLRYCYVTMRNSAMLSMVNKNKIVDEDTVYNYDVFVSYCNEDRPWVLDQLLSHLETDCSVSLCLHERDFQVGLSILENIVSCMDRSKSIMLVISQQFLLSQWCQFEMHLAQHRLLETRREDLILILLEDIPRRLRPTTLHYLMLTKTYIVWPKNKAEQIQFWKRLKKSVITQQHKHMDKVTFA